MNSQEDLKERISGGSIAAIEDYPHQVSLRYDGNIFICGGSIIGNRHILTAAHCLENLVSTFAVYTGSSLSTTGQPHRVESYWIHEKYRGKEDLWDHDVALIQVSVIK